MLRRGECCTVVGVEPRLLHGCRRLLPGASEPATVQHSRVGGSNGATLAGRGAGLGGLAGSEGDAADQRRFSGLRHGLARPTRVHGQGRRRCRGGGGRRCGGDHWRLGAEDQWCRAFDANHSEDGLSRDGGCMAARWVDALTKPSGQRTFQASDTHGFRRRPMPQTARASAASAMSARSCCMSLRVLPSINFPTTAPSVLLSTPDASAPKCMLSTQASAPCGSTLMTEV